jgi:hypothetical protein
MGFMHLPTNRLLGGFFLLLGLVCMGTFWLNSEIRLLGVVFGFVFLFFGGSILSKANTCAVTLRQLLNQRVRVEVWDLPLPVPDPGVFEIESIASFGVGCLVYLRSITGGQPTLLKIAQPSSVHLQEGQIAITFAGYVSWAGKRIKSATGKRAPSTVLFTMA